MADEQESPPSYPPPPGDFSRVVDVSRLGAAPEIHRLTADAVERAAIARAFGLVAIESLTAEVALSRPQDGGPVRLDGRFAADVVQTCVVTLDAFPARIEGEVARVYAVDAPDPAMLDEMEFDLEADDPPDPLIDDAVDVGAAVAEELALALDPYPRKPDATLPEVGDGPVSATVSPFAALRELQKPR